MAQVAQQHLRRSAQPLAASAAAADVKGKDDDVAVINISTVSTENYSVVVNASGNQNDGSTVLVNASADSKVVISNSRTSSSRQVHAPPEEITANELRMLQFGHFRKLKVIGRGSFGTVSTSRMNLMIDVKDSSQKSGSTPHGPILRGGRGGGKPPSWKCSR